MKLLFLCTHNACRSILAEAITRRLAGRRIRVTSAGSHPAGRVHPLTLHHLTRRGYATEGLASKGWDAIQAFAPEVVITVCDQAAGESCPAWLGPAVRAHWGVLDPSRAELEPDRTAAAFDKVIGTLEERLRLLLQEDFERLEAAELKGLLQDLAPEKRDGSA